MPIPVPVPVPVLCPVPWCAFMDEVLRLYDPPMRRRGTRDKTRQVLRELGAFCASTADLGPATIADWIAAHPGRAPATIEGLLRHFSAACTYGALRGHLVDPFDFRPVSAWLPGDELDAAQPFARHRTGEEIRRVLAQADSEALAGGWRAGRLRAVVYVLAYTGAHRTEVLGLRVEDLDLAAGSLAIRSHARRRLKTRARASVLPLAAPLAEVLAAWLPRAECEWAFPHSYRTGPWLWGRPGHRPLDEVQALGDRAGVPGLTMVAFRHTLATLSESWGIGELALQRILRHARRRTQDHYRHPDLGLMRDAMARIDFSAPR